MGHILHDWDLETKRMLIAKAFEAVHSGGSLIVHEAIIDGRSANTFGLMMSLNMLLETPGGFDFTGAGRQSWVRDAGFCQTRVEHLLGPDSMMIGIKWRVPSLLLDVSLKPSESAVFLPGNPRLRR